MFYFSFGTGPSHGPVDEMLTRNDDLTLERMKNRREGTIGRACDKYTKRNPKEGWDIPGVAQVKDSDRNR